MKKNVYLFQINYLHGKSAFLPYAVGTLIANAVSKQEIRDYYSFNEPIFIRENPQNILDKIQNPFLVGFSNYIWNHEYNKVMARMIKEKYPECIIVFGGHHITPDEELMKNEEYIDILSFGEGEETFACLLLALKNNVSLDSVPNIAYREGDKIQQSRKMQPTGIDYPSPYLTGVFDSIFEHYPSLEFHAVFETNRGCPFNCAYCDWGHTNCKVRMFPIQKIFDELKWFSDHNIRGFGCCDANFGMFPRDEIIIDEIVRLHNEYGVLSRFQVSSAKNSNERVFNISKKLNDCNMDKGATLSFQSLNPEVLKNIGRENIPVEAFTALLKKYNKANIPTYSELILALPGETYESFVDGIDVLLDAGQHNAIYIHDCEWLPCSAMGEKEYCEKHGIKTVKVPLNEPHTVLDENEEIAEFSRLVVETNSMTPEDWIKMNIYSATVQAYHNGGLLLLFAVYLRFNKNIAYSEFYKGFIEFVMSNENSVAGKIYAKLRRRLSLVVAGEAGVVWEDRFFGDVGWPSEEYVYLNTVVEFERFYDEVKIFLKSFFDDDCDVFGELFNYQKNVIKLPFKNRTEFNSGYDFKEYFSKLLCNENAKLQKKNCLYVIENPIKCSSWKDYARFVVWYGRKDSRKIYSDEIKTAE